MKTAEEIFASLVHTESILLDRSAHTRVSTAIEAMKLYANQKLDQAAEKADYKTIDKGMAGYKVVIDKESILSLKDEL